MFIRMRNVSERFFGDKVIDILYSITSTENRSVFQIMWIIVIHQKYETNDNIVVGALQAGKPRLQALILNTRFVHILFRLEM